MKIINRVCSIGGVGSTEILKHIENDDFIRIKEHSKRKHTIHPKYLIRTGTKKVLFLIGNPYNSVISVFKRKYARSHEISMNYGKLWFKNEEEMNPVLSQDTKLEEYLDMNLDLFNINEHIENWINYETKSFDIIIVKYEFLEDHIDEIMKFLNCSKPFEIRKRNSNWKEEPEEIRKKLIKIYGDLKLKIDDFPSIIRKLNKKFI